MHALIARAARDLAAAPSAVALTGAGISIESGIPPFRGPGGLWEKIDPMEVAHIDALRRNPQKVWEQLIEGMLTVLAKAAPNPAHRGLATLESQGYLQAVITQNVDELHQRLFLGGLGSSPSNSSSGASSSPSSSFLRFPSR